MEDTFVVEQEVVRTGVIGESFDLLLRFTNSIEQPELYMDELVKLILEGMIQQYGTIVVKVNWFAQGLTVIAPDETPQQAANRHALEGTQEGSGEAIDSNPSPSIKVEK